MFVPRPRLAPWFTLAALSALALLAGGCDASRQACESNVDCYVGESCVLGTCVLDEDPDLDAGPDTPDDNAGDADTDDEDADASPSDRDTGDADTPDEDADTNLPDEPPYPVAISAAANFSCALLSDATVWCWGDNDARVLGNDQMADSTTPVKVEGLDGAVQLALSHTRHCARMDNGSVLCLGDGSSGGLGDGTLNSTTTPVEVIALGATRIGAGTYHSCAAIGADGALRCWGSNTSGETGNEADPTLVPSPVAGLDNVTQIAAGDRHTCVTTNVGAVHCFGDHSELQLGPDGDEGGPQPGTLSFFTSSRPAVELVAGNSHTCAQIPNRSVHCWGDNSFGQLGTPSSSSTRSADPLEVETFAELSGLTAGDNSTCGLDPQGQVYCWGPDVAAEEPGVHQIPGLDSVEDLAIGQSHFCALDANREIFCWGPNDVGQLGNGSRIDTGQPESPVVPSWEDV